MGSKHEKDTVKFGIPTHHQSSGAIGLEETNYQATEPLSKWDHIKTKNNCSKTLQDKSVIPACFHDPFFSTLPGFVPTAKKQDPAQLVDRYWEEQYWISANSKHQQIVLAQLIPETDVWKLQELSSKHLAKSLVTDTFRVVSSTPWLNRLINSTTWSHWPAWTALDNAWLWGSINRTPDSFWSWIEDCEYPMISRVAAINRISCSLHTLLPPPPGNSMWKLCNATHPNPHRTTHKRTRLFGAFQLYLLLIRSNIKNPKTVHYLHCRGSSVHSICDRPNPRRHVNCIR